MTHLKIDRIRTDGGTQSRAAISQETVEEYRQVIDDFRREHAADDRANDWPFRDPIVVYYDGAVYWLADGFHRLAACQQAGRFEVVADIRQGTQRDAILHAAGANADHGLRRTSADKRRAVLRLLEDAEWSQWSDREIARRCKVSHPFVASIRAEISRDTGIITSERTYIDRHGNRATMNTANIGQASAAVASEEPLNSNGDPLRTQESKRSAVVGSVSQELRRQQQIEKSRYNFQPIKDYVATCDWLGEDEQVAADKHLVNVLNWQSNDYDPSEMLRKLESMSLDAISEELYQYKKRYHQDAVINVRRWLRQVIGRQAGKQPAAAAAADAAPTPPTTAVYQGETYQRVERVNANGHNEIAWQKADAPTPLAVAETRPLRDLAIEEMTQAILSMRAPQARHMIAWCHELGKHEPLHVENFFKAAANMIAAINPRLGEEDTAADSARYLQAAAISLAGEEDADLYGDDDDDLMGWLSETPQSVAAIAAAAGVTMRQAAERLTELVMDGIAVEVYSGAYALVDEEVMTSD